MTNFACNCSEESAFKKKIRVELKNVMMRVDLDEASPKSVSVVFRAPDNF